jgi:hypothetical protein
MLGSTRFWEIILLSVKTFGRIQLCSGISVIMNHSYVELVSMSEEMGFSSHKSNLLYVGPMNPVGSITGLLGNKKIHTHVTFWFMRLFFVFRVRVDIALSNLFKLLSSLTF